MIFFYTRHTLISLGLLGMMSCTRTPDTLTLNPELVSGDTVFKEIKATGSELRVLLAAEDSGFKLQLEEQPLGIQLGGAEPGPLISAFSSAVFINSQHTAALVQLQDNSGLVAPFYIISLKSGKPKAYRLYRSSVGNQDVRFMRGRTDIGRSGYLINNDFFVTRVDGRLYYLTRQQPGQRIQGLHLMNSADRQTLIFLVDSALYQVHYPSGKTHTLALPSDAPGKPAALFAWIRQNLIWEKNRDQFQVLMLRKADNRVRSLDEFKK